MAEDSPYVSEPIREGQTLLSTVGESAATRCRSWRWRSLPSSRRRRLWGVLSSGGKVRGRASALSLGVNGDAVFKDAAGHFADNVGQSLTAVVPVAKFSWPAGLLSEGTPETRQTGLIFAADPPPSAHDIIWHLL